MHSKEDKERAALAARAAAKAHLSAVGQTLPPPAFKPGSLSLSSAPLALSEETRKLLASRVALGGAGSSSSGSSSSSSGSSGSGKSSDWVQSPQGFYFHQPSGIAQWAAPKGAAAGTSPLPSGWHLADSPEGPYYYTAHFTNARGQEGQLVTWQRPTAPPHQAMASLTSGM
jgi:hypothetical protein